MIMEEESTRSRRRRISLALVVLLAVVAHVVVATESLECDEIKRDDSYESDVCTFTGLNIDEDTRIHFKRSQIKWGLFNLLTKDLDFGQLTKVEIKNSRVRVVPRVLLQQYTNLESLSIDRCGLKSWHPLTFMHAKYLQRLSLPGNEIKSLPRIAFLNANVLNTIDLRRNQINDVDPFAFINLQSLKSLRLDGNQLLTLDFVLVSNEKLRFLNVSDNRLQKLHLQADTVASLHHPVDLKVVASQNDIADFFIQDTFPVSELYLQDNKLNAMGTVINFKTLKVLDLDSNPLGNLPLTMFFSLGQLQQLNVRHADLVRLNPTLFSRLTRLQHLDLSFNNFTNIDWHIFASLANLEELVIFDYIFSADEVENLSIILPSLKSIWISGQEWDCDEQDEVVEAFKAKGVAVNVAAGQWGPVKYPQENLCMSTLYL